MAGQLFYDQISDSVQDHRVSENYAGDWISIHNLHRSVCLSLTQMYEVTTFIEEFKEAIRWNNAKLRGSNTPEMFRTQKISVHENSDADCNIPMFFTKYRNPFIRKVKNTVLKEFFGVTTRVYYDDQNFKSIKIPVEVAPRLESRRNFFEKRTIRKPNVLDGGSLRRTFDQNAIAKRRLSDLVMMDLHKYSQGGQSMKKVGYYEAFNTVRDGCNTSKTCGTINRSICQNATEADGNETLFFSNLLIRKMKDTESKEELREAARVLESYQNPESIQNRVGVASWLEGRRGIFKRRTIRTSNVPDDGYSWKRYDQKAIPNAKYLRIYFRCPNKYSQGCQASRWVQRIESDAPLFKVTYMGRHTCNQLPQKEATELLILSLTFVFETLSIIFEWLNYALAGTVMSIVGFMICMAEFCYRARVEKVTLKWRGNLPLLYSRYPTLKPFGSIIQWFGLVAAYRVAMARVLHFLQENEENTPKLVTVAAVFCISLAVAKIVK